MLEADFTVDRGEFQLTMDIRSGPGEVVALLGPNASGKTSTLHALAGLVAVDSGEIILDDTLLDSPEHHVFITPENRRVSLVFQDYLLFPHLSTLDNVAFGLRAHGVPAGEARKDALGWLERFGLAEFARRRPVALSGGQAQRVTLARALAPSPSLLLLDEPLSALDAATRIAVRRDLRRHLADFEGTTILVTHDPLDALALASKVVVLDSGQIAQSGPIGELTARPRSRYVAELIGTNLLTGIAHGNTIRVDGCDTTIMATDAPDGDVFTLIDPRAVALFTEEPGGSPRNSWRARIDGFDLLGDRVRVRTTGAAPLVAEITAQAVSELDLHEGLDVWVAVKATEVSVYPR